MGYFRFRQKEPLRFIFERCKRCSIITITEVLVSGIKFMAKELFSIPLYDPFIRIYTFMILLSQNLA